MPELVVQKVNAAMNAVLPDPATGKFLQSIGATPFGGTPLLPARFPRGSAWRFSPIGTSLLHFDAPARHLGPAFA